MNDGISLIPDARGTLHRKGALREMSRKLQMVLFGFLLIGLLGCAQRWSAEDRTPRVSKEELRTMMGRPETVIIDARTEAGWRTSRQKIKGAVRENPLDPERWAGKYSTGSTLIFYCG